jgi:hypothetical protein
MLVSAQDRLVSYEKFCDLMSMVAYNAEHEREWRKQQFPANNKRTSNRGSRSPSTGSLQRSTAAP